MNNAAKQILQEIVQDIGFRLTPKQLQQQLQSIGTSSEHHNVVWRMLNENPNEKEELASKYVNNRRLDKLCPNGNGTRVFVESGSTVLYVANALFDRKAKTNELAVVKTNNNLAARLVLARGHSPYLFAGYLENKYHGIFPFASSDEILPASPTRSNVYSAERTEYAQCRLALQSCSVKLLAASRFSLLHGPIVGSRENAIFKNATYNACVRSLDAANNPDTNRFINLFITPQKLVAHSEENLGKQTSDVSGYHTFTEELDNIQKGECFPAFDVDFPRHESPFTRDLCCGANSNEVRDEVESQLLRDGTLAVSMGEGSFRVCRVWSDLFEKAGLIVDVYLYCEDQTQRDWVKAEVVHARKDKDVTFTLQQKNYTGNEKGLVRIRLQRKGN